MELSVVGLVVTTVIALFLLSFFVYREEKKFNTLPSGLKRPKDKELIKYSIDQLKSFQFVDLSELESYALRKRNNTKSEDLYVKWDDFLRRLDITMNGF